MPAGDHDRRPKVALERRSIFWLAVLTVSLLTGQALAPAAWPVSRWALLAFAIPLPLLIPRRLRLWGLLGVLALLFFAVGYSRHERLLSPSFGPDHLRSLVGDGLPLYVEGVFYREPERLMDRTRWYLKAERIWRPTGAERAEGNVLVTVRRDLRDWRYGDRVRLWLRLRSPRNAGNPGEFDYEGYLARRRIYLTAFLASDEKVELLRREASGPWVWIAAIRGRVRGFLERNLPPAEAGLMKALIIGDRGTIDKEIRKQFTSAGVAHLLAISGLHVGMLGLAVFVLVRYLGSFSTRLLLRWSLPKIAAFVSLLAVLGYAALAGGMIPTARAAVMVAVYVVAVLIDREDELWTSLCIAAIMIGLYWPGAVMDISFQLSFTAVLAIIWGLRSVQSWWPDKPREEEHLLKSRWRRAKVRSIVLYIAVPILASVGTGPMVAYHFGHLSLAGFIANPIVVPVVGMAVVPLGLVIAFVSSVAESLAAPLASLAAPILFFVLGLVRWFASLPMASIAVPTPSLPEVALGYSLIASLFLLRRPRHCVTALCAVCVIGAGAGIYWWRERWERKSLRVTHLSVGHGDAAVVEMPGSKVLLIDAGGASRGDFDPGESIVGPYLRARKIRRVDYVAVSHPRVDHYGGMGAVLENYRPVEFWSGPSAAPTSRYRELEEGARRLGVRRVVVRGAERCTSVDRTEVCAVYLSDGDAGESSLVLRLRFGRAIFLFAGDITQREERRLVERSARLRSSVLKVPRHGSATSSSEAFIAAVGPRLAVVSAGYRNPFGLPREEVLSRYAAAGAEVLRTDRDGAVSVETDGETLRYWTHRSGKRGTLTP